MAEAFDVPAFLQRLRTLGCGLGEPLHYFSETTSTNDLAKAAARQGALHGALFLADAQSAGRGRRGRSWLAAAGEGLLFSFILRPNLEAARLSLLTLSVGLGVHHALSSLCAVPLHVKWPNDVLAAGRKLAGILVESESSPNRHPYVVVGVGINVHTTAFPEAIAARSSSLALEGARAPREEVLAQVLIAIDHWIGQLQRGRVDTIVETLRRHDALLGQRILVDGIEGVARGIDAEGCLLLDSAGLTRPIRSGTVEWPDSAQK